jgi:exopolysaccharide biosynthesis polyprenyl glycosylphosphotransferase
MSIQIRETVLPEVDGARSLNLPEFSLQTQHRALRFVLMTTDGLMLIVALLLASWLRFELRVGLSSGIVAQPAFYTIVMTAMMPLLLAVFAMFGLYDFRYLLGGVDEYARVFSACSVSSLLVVVFAFLEPQFVVSRGWLVYVWLFSVVLVCSARFLIRRVAYFLRHRGFFVSSALIIGVNQEAFALGEQLAAWKTSGLLVLGYIDSDGNRWDETRTDRRVFGTFDALPNVIRNYHVQELIIASSAVSPEDLLELFRRYGTDDSIKLRLSSGLFDIITTGLHVKEMGYVPLVGINKIRLSPPETFVKGIVDYLASTVALVLLSPLLIVIAIAVKLDSPGPVIYRRRVLGRGGKEFDAFKIRSMYVDGDQYLTQEEWTELQTHHKLRQDPRITRVGRILRKYSLDELPQLVNVLMGQMSLIGPRMITPAEKDKYGKWDMNLLTVKPGISGLWQVSGRSDIDYEERVRLDMEYIRNYSFWLDTHLFLRTVVAIITGKGAY